MIAEIHTNIHNFLHLLDDCIVYHGLPIFLYAMQDKGAVSMGSAKKSVFRDGSQTHQFWIVYKGPRWEFEQI